MTRLFWGLVFWGLGFIPVLIGVFWLPWEPTALVARPFLSPSLAHPMGTDWLGRDLLSRVMAGGRASWTIAFLSVAAGGLLGTVLGGIAGLGGEILAEGLLRLFDAVLAFPPVLLALLLAVLLGRGLPGVALALALFNLPYFARLTHAGVLTLKEREFVVAARAAGASTTRVLLRHILPNLASALLVQTTASLSTALLAEASLSYLGLGVQPPEPSWGRMLWEAQGYLFQSPWPAVFPALFLISAVLGLNILGDFLHDYLDPQLRAFILLRPPRDRGRKASTP
ncbi:ABC transporter permease [Candidatus Bipolaricaulota bacterium]|nr:ABC transporter permease [Candidatus Bipolaricaulota bacterium]